MTDQSPSPESPNEQPSASPANPPTMDVPPVAENSVPPQAESLEQQRQQIEEASADAVAVAQSVAKVDLNFPVIGFIDPLQELEKLRKIVDLMPEGDRRAYPESIRAKLLAHQADATANPAVTDEELALAIYLRRTTDTPLTEADIEAKTTGKAPKDPNAPKAPRQTKAKKAADDVFKDLGLPGM